jgi:hypothetical protein
MVSTSESSVVITVQDAKRSETLLLLHKSMDKVCVYRQDDTWNFYPMVTQRKRTKRDQRFGKNCGESDYSTKIIIRNNTL